MGEYFTLYYIGELMKYFWAVLLQLFLIGLNAVFACAEIAVISMNETKLNALTAKGGKSAKKAKKLASLTADPARFLSTIQVAITLAGFLGSAFAADMFAEPIAMALANAFNAPLSVLSPICLVLITLLLAFFNIVFGELVPKRVAMKNSEGVAKALTGVLSFVSVLFKPIVGLLSLSTNGVLRIFGVSPKDEEEVVTEEDILLMAEASAESGNIESEENEMIKNIFEFTDMTIGELCTHRKDVNILYDTQTAEEWQKKIHSSQHSYYPICGETADDVLGILPTKAYFRLEERSVEHLLKHVMRQPLFVYENTPANKVFAQMKKSHEYFAVVTDEYGGMAGIVTIHDLLEAIVGDMDEKNEEAEYTIEKLNGEEWEIHGFAPMYKVENALDVKVQLREDEDYETFNGYICGQLDTLPEDDTQFALSTPQFDIQVLKVEKRCITRLRVIVKPPVEEEGE